MLPRQASDQAGRCCTALLLAAVPFPQPAPNKLLPCSTTTTRTTRITSINHNQSHNHKPQHYITLHYITLHYITLHAPPNKEWEPHSGANERLIRGGNLIENIIVIRKNKRISREEFVRCIDRLSNRNRRQEGIRVCLRVAAHQIATTKITTNHYHHHQQHCFFWFFSFFSFLLLVF
ncbi:hypothetical protein COO60DRAFT_294203 [Scenedesmus sp. NREL 46B-D3]|nr:hypothetical protein COO60DRAFT_294203 [Scenedesmus sp. NREL 46B-D3]